MSNHAYVSTRKPLDPEAVGKVFRDLNARIFLGTLNIKYTDCRGHEDQCSGPHVWEISAPLSGPGGYCNIVCWIRSPRKFEIQHGNASFQWWVDFAITNEIACTFNGTISDDGVGEKWKGTPEKFELPPYHLHFFGKDSIPAALVPMFRKKRLFTTLKSIILRLAKRKREADLLAAARATQPTTNDPTPTTPRRRARRTA